MRISGLSIDGFGHFAEVEVRELPAGLVVVAGANEAGKSTCLAFVHAVLFGFPDGRSRERSYPPLAGGTPGGRLLLVVDGHGEVVVERRPGARGGPVTVSFADGRREGEPALLALLGGVDRATFRNLYGFSLAELQSLEALSSEQLREVVYGASFGTGAQSLPRATQAIQARLDELFKQGGSKPLVNELLGQLEAVRERLRAASADSASYGHLVARLDQLDRLIGDDDQRLRAARQRRQATGALLAAWDEWTALQLNRRELAALPERVSAFPPAAGERLTACTAAAEAAARAVRGEERELEAVVAAHAELVVDDDVIAAAAAIRDLAAGLDACARAERTLPAATVRAGAAASAAAVRLATFGAGWSEAAALAVDRSPPALATVDAWRGELETGRTAVARTADRSAQLAVDRAAAEAAVTAAAAVVADLADERPVVDAAVVAALANGRDELVGLARDIPKRQAERRAAAEALTEILAGIDPGWSAADLDHVDTSVTSEQRRGELEERLARARGEVAALGEELRGAAARTERAAALAERQRQQLAALPAAPSQEASEARRRAVRELRATLAERRRLDDRRQALTERLADLAGGGTGSVVVAERAVAALAVVVGLGALVTLWLRQPLAAAAAVVAVALALTAWRLRRAAAGGPSGERRRAVAAELAELERRGGDLAARVAELAPAADILGEVDEAGLDRAEDELAASVAADQRRRAAGEELARLDEAAAAAAAERERAEQELAAATAELAATTGQWSAFASSFGLAAGTSPSTLRQVLARAGEGLRRRREVAELDHRLTEMERVRADYLGLAAGVPELADAAARAPAEAAAAIDRFLAAEDERARRRQRREVAEGTWRERQRNLEAVDARLQAAAAEHTAAVADQAVAAARWHSWLAARGLDPAWSPDTCRGFLGELAALADLVAERERAAAEAAAAAAEVADFEAAAAALLARLGRPRPPAGAVAAAVRALADEREMQLARARRRHELTAEIGERRSRLAAARAEAELAAAGLAALLAAAGASDEADFHRRRELHERLVRADEAVARAERAVCSIAGAADLAPLETALAATSRDELAVAVDALDEEVAALEAGLEELRAEHTEARVRRDDLAATNAVAALRAAEEGLLAELCALAAEWSRFALARQLLVAAKERFEESHQPRVIQEAGRFFRLVTDGRYQRVVAAHGEGRVEVVDASGRRLPAEALSRGTQEQLYLAIRFGYVAARERGGARLPLVMDDVLVNFDPERARRAAAAIAAAASANQVLFFTCHPETVATFAEVAAGVPVYDLVERSIRQRC